MGYFDCYSNTFCFLRNLERLYIDMFEGTPSSSNAIRTILKSNKGLKFLKFDDPYLFNQDFSTEIDFKLAELQIDYIGEEQIFSHNLNLFLKTQRDTLETVETLADWTDVDVMKTILSMPRLKNLTLGDFEFDALEIAEALPPNNSVKSLHLLDWDNYSECDFFFKVCPKVEFLEMNEITDEIADLISETCKSLKRLCVHRFRAKNIKDEAFFSDLDEISCGEVASYSEGLTERLRIHTVV